MVMMDTNSNLLLGKPKALGTTAAAGAQNNERRPETAKQRPLTARRTTDTSKRDSLGRNGDFQWVSSELLEQKSVVLDPLSQQILRRTTQAVTSLSPKPLRDNESSIESESLARVQTESFQSDTASVSGVTIAASLKEKKKSGSFFSRIIGNKKKEVVIDEETDTGSEQTDDRPEGADAELFYQPFENLEYNPRHPPPPPYIKVRSQGKKDKEFNRMFLAQRLIDEESLPPISRRQSTQSVGKLKKANKQGNEGGAVWTVEFSKDGRYLATAAQDGKVRLWATIASQADRRAFEREEEAQNGGHLSAPVFSKKPYRRFEGHTGAVLDLTWSKNNFLLSSSIDKTVRLWHVSRDECLCTFKHTDYVTSIQFHPKDDRFFLAGSMDAKLRLWSIPDKSVAYWVQASEIITAVAFTPDGKMAVAGCLNGVCLFYETERLKYTSQMLVKSSHGKNARGSKITGIQAINMPPHNPHGDIKLLVTSNDSRVRLYNYRDKSLEMKFKGTENVASQIHAKFSDDGRYIICGSEDNKVFIWSVQSIDYDRKAKHPVEVFEAHNAITTACATAPVQTRQLLGNSEDPIFDICNPPPVTLISKSEAESIRSFGLQNDTSSIMQTPATAEGGGSFPRKTEESPSYLARSTHMGGNIIVTADGSGAIKVFRQDCAHEKRRPDSWDTASIVSKKIGLQRQSSVTTRASSRSRRDSITIQPAPEQILSWRQDTRSNASSSDGISPARRQNSEHGGIARATSHGSSMSGKGLSKLSSIRSSFGRGGSNTSNAQLLKLSHASTMPEKDEFVAEAGNMNDDTSSLKGSSSFSSDHHGARVMPAPKLKHAATLPVALPSTLDKLTPNSSPPTPEKASRHRHLHLRRGHSRHGSSSSSKGNAVAPIIVAPPTPTDSHSSLPSVSIVAPATADEHQLNHHLVLGLAKGEANSEGEGDEDSVPELSRRSSYTYWHDVAWRDSIRDQLEGHNPRKWSAAFSDGTSLLPSLSTAPTRDGHLAVSGNASRSQAGSVKGHSRGTSPTRSGLAPSTTGGGGASGDSLQPGNLLMVPLQRSVSAVSKLTDEEDVEGEDSSEVEGDEEFQDAEEGVSSSTSALHHHHHQQQQQHIHRLPLHGCDGITSSERALLTHAKV